MRVFVFYQPLQYVDAAEGIYFWSQNEQITLLLKLFLMDKFGYL